MFDVGFQELTLIGVIALIVVGPERLPKMARTLGLWMGKIRYYVGQVKSDIEREGARAGTQGDARQACRRAR